MDIEKSERKCYRLHLCFVRHVELEAWKLLTSSLYLCLLPGLFWAENRANGPLQNVRSVTSCIFTCSLQFTCKRTFSVQAAAQCALWSQLWPCGASCLVIYANWRPSLRALFRCMRAFSLLIWGFKWAQGWQESPQERLQLACGAGAIRVGLIACLVTFLSNSCPPTNVRPKGLALEFW